MVILLTGNKETKCFYSLVLNTIFFLSCWTVYYRLVLNLYIVNKMADSTTSSQALEIQSYNLAEIFSNIPEIEGDQIFSQIFLIACDYTFITFDQL